MPNVRCVDCGQLYPETGVPHRCLSCGGIFDFDGVFDFHLELVERELPGYWRYNHAFGLPSDAPIVSLGEGNTPLIWDNTTGPDPIGLKFESLNPTGSYKDRGSAVLMSFLLSRGVSEAVEDSSGNAGASFAAYAAKASVIGRVFVPEAASGPKRQQIEAYGAELVRVPGPRSEAARAVLTAVECGLPYASHAYLPFGMAGISTIAYELYEQMENAFPGTVIAPVGHGGLLLGLMRGFKSLQNARLIPHLPYFVGVQAAACDPVVRGFNHGIESMTLAPELVTLAEGVRVKTPVRAPAILREIDRERAVFVAIQEGEIQQAFTKMCRKGYYVEPTSALVWAAYEKLKNVLIPPVVMILSGNGLKYIS